MGAKSISALCVQIKRKDHFKCESYGHVASKCMNEAGLSNENVGNGSKRAEVRMQSSLEIRRRTKKPQF